ncbi:DNA-processing protein DprA [Gordonia sihwensis]|uniref:DNA-processing protein DprA n=1 Tax=Gordonia sihwensis TaxID=173559 RepID=UPI000A9BEE8B|nr:DNA-processing protein DprA [Gordonia sihwensis]
MTTTATVSERPDTVAAAWAYLAAVADGPNPALRSFIAERGVRMAADAIESGIVPDEYAESLDPVLRRAQQLDWAKLTADTAEADAVILTPEHELWPHRLADLGDQAPFALWVRGPAAADLAAGGVVVDGTRASSSYGAFVSERFGADLAKAGHTVFGTGSYGCSGKAARGALDADGTAVAVLAAGIDRQYPRPASELLADIETRGVLVSEYAPGVVASKRRRLERNRILAALASVVVVVEAGRRSGAIHSARQAARLGRMVGGVPSPVTSAYGIGVHAILQDGTAQLVTSAQDALDLVAD